MNDPITSYNAFTIQGDLDSLTMFGDAITIAIPTQLKGFTESIERQSVTASMLELKARNRSTVDPIDVQALEPGCFAPSTSDLDGLFYNVNFVYTLVEEGYLKEPFAQSLFIPKSAQLAQGDKNRLVNHSRYIHLNTRALDTVKAHMAMLDDRCDDLDRRIGPNL